MFQCPFFCIQASDNIKPIIILLTLGVNLRSNFSLFVNLDLKLIELIPICLFHKAILLLEVLVENFLKLNIEKDFDEGYTLNGKYNEMAHVAAVKYALVKQKLDSILAKNK